MTRGFILTLGLLAAGCSNDPPPLREAAPISGEKVVIADFAPPERPAKSDPAAAKLITAALVAHGCSDPATLAKLKAVSLRRTALTTTPDGFRAPLDWRVDLLSPSRCRVDAVLKHPQGIQTFTILLAPDAGSISATGRPETKKPVTGELLHDCHAQLTEDEFLLVFPLADPSTIAVSAPAITVNGSPASGVYAWTPALTPVLVHFDNKTGRIVRVVYRGREAGKELLKEITILEHMEFAGVWLPSKYDLRTNGRIFMEVEKQTFEIGKKFPADHFKP